MMEHLVRLKPRLLSMRNSRQVRWAPSVKSFVFCCVLR